MIQFHKIQPSSSREDWTDTFDISTSTWLVADLEQKRAVQNALLEKYSYLPEDACLRASELWIKLLAMVDPHTAVVSKPLVEAVLQQWLPERQLSWASGPSAVPTLLDYLQFFLPVLCSEDPEASVALMHGWLKENRDSMVRWGGWFELCFHAWEELRRRKITLAPWVPSLLAGAARGTLPWKRDLLLDLGAEISSVESELFLKLGEQNSIEVLMPADPWRQKYPKVLWPYDLLSPIPTSSTPGSIASSGEGRLQCLKFITKLSEVKACVSQVRSWLDAGARPEQIAIYAVDPEEYWPVLRQYLEEEGVPVAKDVVTVLQAIPAVGQWLANMRVQVKLLSSEDFEMSLYGQRMRLEVDYENFRVLLSEIYEQEDLTRLRELKDLFHEKVRAGQVLDRDAFIAFAVRNWDLHEDPEIFKDVISAILLESAADVRLPVEGWISYAQAIAAKAERRVQEGHPDGVKIRKFTSAILHTAPYVFCLGLDEASLTDIENVNVTFSEILRIGQDIGYHLPRPETGAASFLAQWLARSKFQECFLSYPMTDFNGEPSAPSLFWFDEARILNGGEPVEAEPNVAGLSRWDEIQRSPMQDLPQRRSALSDAFSDHLRRDRGDVQPELILVEGAPKWSASQLENYKKCPFKFTANRLFRLRDEPEVDLDMDRMRRGRLLHKTLDLVMQQGLERQWEDKDLLDLIEVARFAEGIYVYPSIWPQYKLTFLRLLKSFLDFELQWRAQFPKTKTVATELAFAGEWLGHPLQGTIDRVDADDQGRYVILDYKASGTELKNYGSWLNNHQLQLLVYVKAIESGWTSLPAGPVVAANYFNLKDMNRDKGFCLGDESVQLYPPPSGRGNRIDAEGLEKLKATFDDLAVEISQQMAEGRFFAAPENEDKHCKHCEWSTLCRAPHMNH